MGRRIRAWLLNPVVAAGLWIGLLGAAMNYSVLQANGGMPVCGRVQRSGLHIAMTEYTELNWLADWIHMGDTTRSPGDVLIHAAILVSIIGVIWGYYYGNDGRRIA